MHAFPQPPPPPCATDVFTTCRASGMKWWIRCRVLKVGKQEVYRRRCVYLFNHRSWGDFIVDQYVTEGRSLFMSRMAVLFVFPTFIGALKVLKSIILFKRGSIANKEVGGVRAALAGCRTPQYGFVQYRHTQPHAYLVAALSHCCRNSTSGSTSSWLIARRQACLCTLRVTAPRWASRCR